MLIDKKFTLHERLEKDSFLLTSLDLCQVRLINNSDYTWLILVPQKNNIIHLTDLNSAEQIQLIKEINHISTILKKLYTPDRLNIATLGNVVSQMHWHIIVRYTTDKHWPNPVWGRDFTPYSNHELQKTLATLQNAL